MWIHPSVFTFKLRVWWFMWTICIIPCIIYINYKTKKSIAKTVVVLITLTFAMAVFVLKMVFSF